MNVRPDRTLHLPRTDRTLEKVKAFSIQTSSALQAPHSALQRCLSWLAATPLAVGLCLAAAPSAQAASFTDPNDNSNPFLYSNWTLLSGGSDPSAIVTQPGNTSILFSSSGAGTDTFTSGITNQPYIVSFDYSFVPDEDTSVNAFYQICGVSCDEETQLGLLNSNANITVDTGKSLRFGINNVGGGGDLTISNFNAEGVPAPLSALGAGAAFGWIRRRRAQLKAHQSFHL
jgi:hypothetical protein